MTAPPRARALLLLPPLLFLLLYAFYTPDVVTVQPDSPGYLEFANGRSGGYPAFLALLKPLIRGVADYTIAQRVLYALAVLALALQIARTFGGVAIACVAEVALLFNPEVNRYHFIIVSESVFLSSLTLFLAAALAYLRTGRTGWFAATALAAAASMTVRPTGIVLLPLLVVLALARAGVTWRDFAKLVVVGAVTAGSVLALEGVYFRAHHSMPRVSLAPIHFLAKAGMVDVPHAAAIVAAAPAAAQPLQRALEIDLAPVRRVVQGAPSGGARCKLLPASEVFVQYDFAPRERALAIGDGDANRLLPVGLARLSHGVGGYLALSAAHLRCLWTLGAITGAEEEALAAYLEAQKPLAYQDTILASVAAARTPPFGGIVRIVMYAIAAALLAPGLVLLAAIARRRTPSPELALAGLAGLIVHGCMLLTALTAVGIPRYVLGLWAPLAIGLGMAALALMRATRFRTSRSSAPRAAA